MRKSGYFSTSFVNCHPSHHDDPNMMENCLETSILTRMGQNLSVTFEKKP